MQTNQTSWNATTNKSLFVLEQQLFDSNSKILLLSNP